MVFSAGDTIQFLYNVGNGIQVLAYKTINGLNNNLWHTVHVERNRKQAWMRVDNFPEVVRNEPQDEITRLLDLTKPLTVGAAVDHRDGFVGCMRGLRVNGVLMDMKGQVTRGQVTYGVSEGMSLIAARTVTLYHIAPLFMPPGVDRSIVYSFWFVPLSISLSAKTFTLAISFDW